MSHFHSRLADCFKMVWVAVLFCSFLTGVAPNAGETTYPAGDQPNELTEDDVRTFLECGPSGVTSFCFTGDGGILVTGHKDGALCFWDTQTSQRLAKHAAHRSPIDLLMTPGDQNWIISVAGSQIRLWKATPESQSFKDFTRPVSSEPMAAAPTEVNVDKHTVDLSPDGSLVALMGGDDVDSGTVVIYRTEDGSVMHSLDCCVGLPKPTSRVSILGIAFVKGGEELLTICNGGSGNEDVTAAQLWNVSSGKPLKAIECEPMFTWGGLSPDRSFAVGRTFKRELAIMDIDSAAEVSFKQSERADARRFYFSHDGKCFATQGDSNPRLFRRHPVESFMPTALKNSETGEDAWEQTAVSWMEFAPRAPFAVIGYPTRASRTSKTEMTVAFCDDSLSKVIGKITVPCADNGVAIELGSYCSISANGEVVAYAVSPKQLCVIRRAKLLAYASQQYNKQQVAKERERRTKFAASREAAARAEEVTRLRQPSWQGTEDLNALLSPFGSAFPEVNQAVEKFIRYGNVELAEKAIGGDRFDREDAAEAAEVHRGSLKERRFTYSAPYRVDPFGEKDGELVVAAQLPLRCRVASDFVGLVSACNVTNDVWQISDDKKLRPWGALNGALGPDAPVDRLYVGENTGATDLLLHVFLDRDGREAYKRLSRERDKHVVNVQFTKIEMAKPNTQGYFKLGALRLSRWDCESIRRTAAVGLNAGPGSPNYFVTTTDVPEAGWGDVVAVEIVRVDASERKVIWTAGAVK